MALDANIFFQGAALKQRNNEQLQSTIGNFFDTLAQDKLNKQKMAMAEREMALMEQMAQQKGSEFDLDAMAQMGLYKFASGVEPSPQEMAAIKAADYKRQTALTVDPATGRPIPAARSILDVMGVPAQPNRPQFAPASGMVPVTMEELQAPVGSEGIKLDGPAPNIMDTLTKATGEGYVPPKPSNPLQEKEAYGSKLKIAEEKAKADIDTGKKKQEAAPKVAAGIASLSDKVGNLNSQIDEATAMISGRTAGLGSIASAIPGTKAADLAAILETIKADAAFSALQEMRDNSPTGGALGNVSERELSLLQSAQAALTTSQSPAQLKRKLQEYKMARQNALMRVKKAYKDTYGELPNTRESENSQQTTGGSAIEAEMRRRGLLK